ncbi:deoxynucleoside kinase [Candidatus Clostridium radicumherbarum]|uniref:Deoxynucleoside kinase n=1 Tax=Candidatus Clostridium radicumherbarum TaxID=3381662 RepID=A0ABW8TU28_9CLOT
MSFYNEILNHVGYGGYNSMKQNNSIIIDAVVGAGKSALMQLLEEERGFKAFPEPVVDNPLLDDFYHDRQRYSFPLQIFFLNKRFKHIKEAAEIKNAIMDRSIYGDAIFSKLLHDNNEMSTVEFELYCELLQNMLEHVQKPKLMIYLEISTDEAIKRINKRGRAYELIVERDYWEHLNREYRAYFSQYDISPLLTINVDGLDFIGNEKDKAYVLGLIDNKLKEIEGKI